jgi:hypothetical protein
MQGQNTFQFQRYSQHYGDASEKSFSIVYLDEDGRERTLNLIAPSPDIFKLWHDGVKALVTKLKEQRQNYSLDSLFLKSLWDRADTDHSGTLNAKEIIGLVASINVNLPNETIKSLFKKYDVDQSGTLDFTEFVEFMSFLRKRCATRFYGIVVPGLITSFCVTELIWRPSGISSPATVPSRQPTYPSCWTPSTSLRATQ